MACLKKLKKRSLTSEMERNVRQMLKLIEEDGDSFAQKAEMYYQKRPEMISLVEEFYRGYRSLAERYEQYVTGDSDNGSEPPSSWPSPSPRKTGRRISSNRAPGFDFFLGSGGNNGNYDACQKDGDAGSSTLTDSDDEFDDASSINSYSGNFFGNNNASDYHGMNKRVVELEMELREVKEKLCMYEEERVEGSSRGTRIENADNGFAKINAYEQEVRNLNEKLRLSEEEINKLKIEIEKYKAMESTEGEAMDLKTIGEELRRAKEKVDFSDMQIASLRFEASKSCESIQQLHDQLNLAHKDIATWKTKFNSEKRESTKLQERLARLKIRDHEMRDLKAALSEAEQKNFFEKAQLKSEMSKLLEQQTHMEEKIREREIHSMSLEEEIRKIQYEKIEMEETLKGEIELLKEGIKDRKTNIEDLNVTLDALILERDNLNEEVGSLNEEITSRDNQIENMNMQLNQLHMEHTQMRAGIEEVHRHMGVLKSRAEELEEEIERQKVEILEGAEEKREAIRQLCFSLEHYRNGYNVLRQAFIGHKRFPVLAA